MTDSEEVFRMMLNEAGGGGRAERELTSALDRLLANPRADRLAWARQNGQGATFVGAAWTTGQALLQKTDLESLNRLARLSDVMTAALFSGKHDQFTGTALTMLLRKVDEDGVGPRDPSDSPAGRMRRVCNYRGCRLAEIAAAYAVAKDHFDACINIDPRFAPAFCNRARMWIELGNLAAARSDCDAVTAFDPKYPVLVVTRKLIDALQLMSQRHGRNYAEIAAAHGLLDYLRRYDRPPRSGEMGGTVSELPDPFDPPTLGRNPTASEANHRGVVLGRMGRYQEADAVLTAAIRRDAEFARAYFNRGKVRLLAGNSAGAIADLTAYINRNSGDADAYRLRAQALRNAGQHDKAAADEHAAALWSS